MGIIKTFEKFNKPIPITKIGEKDFEGLVNLKNHLRYMINKGYTVDQMMQNAETYPFDLRDVLHMMSKLW